MASQFIGLHMRVVLREPPGYYLTGTVKDVAAGNSLTLMRVSVPGSSEQAPHVTIDANNIADLSEVKPEPIPPTYIAPPVKPAVAPVFTQPALPSPFVDPAILSMGRRPGSSSTPTGTPTARKPPKSEPADPQLGQPGVLPVRSVKGALKDITPEQELLSSMQDLRAQDSIHELDDGKPAELETQQKQKKKGRARPARKSKAPTVDEDTHPIDGTPATSVQGTHGKGWRETPILQSTASFQPFNSLKRNGKGSKATADNGWASEDVTEEMGDFDFENNLAKFDKRTIFDQMRKDDQVDDSERLVTHNRRPKPGTGGGKNLHYTENVLDVPANPAQHADFWNSEADVGVHEPERLSGREMRSSQSMRRAESKTGATRRSQSRKASGMAGPVVGGIPMSRVNSTQQNTPQAQGHQPGLYLLPSNRRLETISTLQMLNLENIAANELGFTEDLMAENAGRGIAEVAFTALSDPAMKARYELAMASLPPDATANPTTVVILAGKNKSSVRALAAGRHLRNKGINVIVCLVGIEREKELLEDLRRQIQLYRNFGGKVLSKNDFFEYLRKTSASGGRAAWVSLIIDALLGLTISFDELRIGDQATVYELMEWANRNEAFVLSVDIPSGIDPVSGKIAIIDGGQLFVKPRYVVSLGAPKRGLLEAVTPSPEGDLEPFSNAAQEDHWRLFIADMGLGSAVWRKAGTKVRKGIDFDGKWVLEMKYKGAEVDYEED